MLPTAPLIVSVAAHPPWMGVHLLEFNLVGCHRRPHGIENEKAGAGCALVYRADIPVLGIFFGLPALWFFRVGHGCD